MLWAHDHTKPIGKVTEARVAADGIRVTAEIVRGIDEADRAWIALKAGVPLGFSIGFQAIKTEPRAGGGVTYSKWSWYELSVVSVPAQPEAKIEQVIGKSAGAVSLAHSSRGSHDGSVKLKTPPSGSVRLIRKGTRGNSCDAIKLIQRGYR